jgi:hypothetical protein
VKSQGKTESEFGVCQVKCFDLQLESVVFLIVSLSTHLAAFKVALGPSDNKFRMKIRSEKPRKTSIFLFSSLGFGFSPLALPNEPLVRRCVYKRDYTEKKIICSPILSHEFPMISCSQS